LRWIAERLAAFGIVIQPQRPKPPRYYEVQDEDEMDG
jgi:hypothetical protein